MTVNYQIEFHDSVFGVFIFSLSHRFCPNEFLLLKRKFISRHDFYGLDSTIYHIYSMLCQMHCYILKKSPCSLK